MTDSTLELLHLINEGKTANEIATELNISNKQLYNRITMLRNKGFDFEKKYYYDGNIIYVPKTNLYPFKNSVNLFTTPKEQIFTAILISDLHIGNELQRLDLLDKVYEYCVKEGIHIIINGGDLIDGIVQTLNAKTKLYDNASEQIDYLLKVYPFDKNILNFTLLGNHDFSTLQHTGQNLATILENYRHDIIPIGYEKGKVNIKNSSIYIKHPINNDIIFESAIKDSLIFKGHSHKMKVACDNGDCCVISIPSLSDINYSSDAIVPTLLRLDAEFTKGVITNGIIKQLLISDKIFCLNETNFKLPFALNHASEEIKYEETPEKKLVRKEEKYTSNMSQIEKFNARYSLRKNS